MIKFNSVDFRYDPYPIGFTRNIFPDDLYAELADSFPSVAQLRQAANMGDNKFLLTEFETARYIDVIEAAPPWRRLYDYVKTKSFVDHTLQMLLDANIDPGLKGLDVVCASHYDSPAKRFTGRVGRKLTSVLQGGSAGHLTSRFEFSALQGKVASHLPHTDAPRKVISMVISMMKEGEWDPSWGGGTAVCRPKDMSRSYNYMNRYMAFDEVDILHTYPFVPNGCVVFVKTFNSWHTVMPYSAPPDVVRKSIVINIDCPQALGAQTRQP